MSLNRFNKLYAPPCYVDDYGELDTKIDSSLIEWHRNELQKSKNFLRSQRGWKSADPCMSILYGDYNPQPMGNLSVLTIKKLRRQTREAVANASNIRPRWQTKAKKEYQPVAEIYNKRRDAWFYNLFIDRYIKEALQWGGGSGTGYLMLWPEPNPRNKNRLEIMPKVLSHKNVFPFHASADSRIETVYGITAWFEMALPEAHEKWPEHMDVIKADRDIPSYFAGRIERTSPAGKNIFDWIGRSKSANTEFNPYPVADIFFTWVRDNSVNECGHEILMGDDPRSAYSYTVPSLYGPMETGGGQNKILDGLVYHLGQPEYDDPRARLITRNECKLFPNLRFMITTSYGVIYDGPPLFICNRPPITWFKFEEVPSEWLGISLIRDGRNPERAANNLLRAIEDAIVGRIQPPMAINDQLPKGIKDRLTRSARRMIGMVFKYNTMMLEKAIVPLLPAEYFDIDARAIELVKFLHEMSDYLMGTADFSAWQRLKQLPAADTQESMLQNLGVLATDHERTIERSILEMADIWQQFAPQVYTVDELITTLGKDGISEVTWDFKANSMFPQKDPNDNRSLNQRLLDHMDIFSIHASPHSIQERMSVTNKLTMGQLRKMELPISDEKLYNTFLDDGGYEESLAQFNAEQEAKIKRAAKLNAELQQAAQQSQGNPQVDKLIEVIRGQDNHEGRPSQNTSQPELKQKTDQDGIPRSTVATT
jgi:hypothetical protein